MGRIRDFITRRRSLSQVVSIEEQASAVGGLIAAATRGLPRTAGMKATEYAREGFAENVIGFRCVLEISKALATVPLMIYRGDLQLTESSPLVNLLKRPNPEQGWQSLIADLVAFHRISGNAFLEAVPEGGEPQELYSLRPDRMSIHTGPDGFPDQYIYRVGTRTKKFDVDFVSRSSNILHWRTFNPTDDYLGLSPITAAALSIDQHNSANRWNTRLIENDARPPGTFAVPKGMQLQPKQREELEEKINEKISGPEHAGKILIQAGLEWQQMGFSPHDMDWLNSKHTSARDICNAFGFPSMLLGIPGDNTYSNYKEARLALYEDTVIPLLEELVGELNNWLTPRFGADLELRADWDQVSALAERRESKWARIGGADFLSLNEKRTELGWEPREGGDDILIPANLVPLGFEPAELSQREFREELKSQGYSETTAAKLAEFAYGD
jgi:HK97 family phage portal protein